MDLKIVVVGDTNTHKTEFTQQITNGEYITSTIGANLVNKTVKVNDKKYRTQIWDISIKGDFRSISGSYCRKAKGVFLLYNVAVRSTFDSLNDYIRSIKENAEDDVVFMLIGNKSNQDDEKLITTEEGQSFAQSNIFLFSEVETYQNLKNENLLIDLVTEIDKFQCTLQEQEKPKEEESPKKSFFSKIKDIFTPNQQENNQSDHLMISYANFDKIIERMRFLENHLNNYEKVGSFNFETFEIDDVTEYKNDEDEK